MAQAAAQPIVASVTPIRVFEDHESTVLAVAVFPDGRRMVTSSGDKTVRLWDLKNGVVLKKMEGHRHWVRAVAVSKDGQLIASGDLSGELIAWHGDTGEQHLRVTQPIRAHSGARIVSLDFSPDGAVLATGSSDNTTKLWNTETWLPLGYRINCGAAVGCVRYSPSGEHIAIATDKGIQIWDPSRRDCVANFNAHADVSPGRNYSLAWTPDGTRLFSGGSHNDPTIREWDLSTKQQVGDPWDGHTDYIYAIAVNPAGTLVTSASEDKHVRLWRLWDRRTIAIFKHLDPVCCVTFSMDGKHILSGYQDKKISKWAVPEDASPDCKIIAMDLTARDACMTGDLQTAEGLLTQAIDADANDHISYANRSFVMARKLDWDRALLDADKSVGIKPSLTGYMSKGIALCGKEQLQHAMEVFDFASMFTNGDLNTIHFLLLIKAIALFNANQHDEALRRVRGLAAACPDADTLACCIVEAYLRVHLGYNAFGGVRYNEAVDHFTAAIDISAFSSKWAIHSIYEDFVVLFGWNLKSLWQTANQYRCRALLKAGRLGEAMESHRYMMDMIDENTRARCLNWSTSFKKECGVLYTSQGNAALVASDYDRAICLYSAAIDLSPSETIFASRSKAKSEKMLWKEALLDAQKVIELNNSSYLGYQLKHAALHGAHRYDEAIEAFQIMLSKLDSAPETQIRRLRQQYVSPSEVEGAIRKVIDTQLDHAPLHLLNTFTGRLCNREAQINAFKMSSEYKELLSSTTKYANLRTERIKEVVMKYFRRVMLSHRWEGDEPLLHDIRGKVVYQLDPVPDGNKKLQSFCKIVRDAGYLWAWSDTCCIDKSNPSEHQQSLNSMFIWYRHSALTIVYLSDVPLSSRPGALAGSVWIKRGWTVQEFLAPKAVLFYQKDWTLYLGDRSPNHKESVAIMQELGDATGIDPRALVAFRPGKRGAREKLQWASRRVTTLQEDIAYSLFGLFGVHLPVIYGEGREDALGRLLQEIVAQSGDISALDWVGRSSKFNSCLPADIASYEAAPCALPSVSEEEMEASLSSLEGAGSGVVQLAANLYTTLDNLSAPRFSQCRLHLPCITFKITEVRFIRRNGQDQDSCATYEVKTDGLHDLQITTEDRLVPFSPARPPTWQTFLLVRPWNRYLLELPDTVYDAQSVQDWSTPGPSTAPLAGSHGENWPGDSDPQSRALRLIVRLGRPCSVFLLARQRGGEYKRIASDHDIIAQVKDLTSVRNMMDVRTLEIS